MKAPIVPAGVSFAPGTVTTCDDCSSRRWRLLTVAVICKVMESVIKRRIQIIFCEIDFSVTSSAVL